MTKMRSQYRQRDRKRAIFYAIMMAFPLLQFAVFYIGVNANSIVMAFQSYKYDQGMYVFTGLANFRAVFTDIMTVGYLKSAIVRSLIVYAFTLTIGVTLAVLFSYYIYKKFRGGEVFKVFLFLPSVISSVVLVIMFNYFVERAIPFVLGFITGKNVPGLVTNPDTVFVTILFYTIWAGFGTQILMYSGAMNGISDSVVESAQLDGITPLKEFFHITLPLIWPTFTTFIVVGVAGIFTNQMNLFSFFGTSAEYGLYTVGYYLYRAMKASTTTLADYPYYAAIGIVFTMISIPVTLLVRHLLFRLGPKDC